LLSSEPILEQNLVETESRPLLQGAKVETSRLMDALGPPTDRLTDVHVLVLDGGLARLDTLRGLKLIVIVRYGW